MKGRLLLTLFFVFLVGYAVYLLIILKGGPERQVIPGINNPGEQKADALPGEVIINEPGRYGGDPYKVIVLSKVFLKNHRVYLADDSKTSMVDLELGFVKDQEEKSIFVTLIGKVGYRITREEDGEFENEVKGVVSVDTVEFVKGERLSVTLEYVTDKDAAIKYFEENCNNISSLIVCDYLKYGYGNEPITGEEFNSMIQKKGNRLLPSQILVSNLTRILQYPNNYE
jgi:hypothetical protein